MKTFGKSSLILPIFLIVIIPIAVLLFFKQKELGIWGGTIFILCACLSLGISTFKISKDTISIAWLLPFGKKRIIQVNELDKVLINRKGPGLNWVKFELSNGENLRVSTSMSWFELKRMYKYMENIGINVDSIPL